VIGLLDYLSVKYHPGEYSTRKTSILLFPISPCPTGFSSVVRREHRVTRPDRKLGLASVQVKSAHHPCKDILASISSILFRHRPRYCTTPTAVYTCRHNANDLVCRSECHPPTQTSRTSPVQRPWPNRAPVATILRACHSAARPRPPTPMATRNLRRSVTARVRTAKRDAQALSPSLRPPRLSKPKDAQVSPT
jgi:hypothetical protein